MSSKIVVYHSDNGMTCGHMVSREHDDRLRFHLTHPFGKDPRTFAEMLVRHTYGPDYVRDLAWGECEVTDD